MKSSRYKFAIDVETTGAHLSRNAMIAFGATIIDSENSEEVESFVDYLKVPENRSWEERCLNDFWSKQVELKKYIEERMKDPKEVMEKFKKWVDEIDLKYGDDMDILSDFAAFDYGWINLYLSLYADRLPLYFKCKKDKDGNINYSFRDNSCTGSQYRGALKYKTGDALKSPWDLEKQLQIENGKFTNDHNPLNDARNIALNYILFEKKCVDRKRKFDDIKEDINTRCKFSLHDCKESLKLIYPRNDTMDTTPQGLYDTFMAQIHNLDKILNAVEELKDE